MIFFTASGAMLNAFAKQFECKKISIRKKGISQLISCINDDDIVVHNAANISPNSLEEALNDNYALTKNVVDALVDCKKKVKLIFISSMSILENESMYKQETEMTTYAYSKYLAEKYCLSSSLNVICVRFSTLFYKNPEKDGLSKLIVNAVVNNKIETINNGIDSRDFIPLEIAMQYLKKICETRLPEKIYNIASSTTTSFNEVANILKTIIPTLIIKNKNTEPNTFFVLSNFSNTSLIQLKQIDFSLSSCIKNYIKEINESNNI